MNLFVTSHDPQACAQALDDRRLIKATLETAQLISTAARIHNPKLEHNAYKSTHANHPVSRWVRHTAGNYIWAWDHFIALGYEYAKRFNKVHKCTDFLTPLYHTAQLMPPGNRTPFCNAARNKNLQLDFTYLPIFIAYQAYLNTKWSRETPKWTNTKPPAWRA